MKHSDSLHYKKQQRQRMLNFQPNPQFSHEFRDELEKYGSDGDELRKPADKRSKVKVIVSNHVVEVFEYSEGVRVGPRPKSDQYNIDFETGEILEKEKKSSNAQEVKRNNARRARNEARRLVLANFDNGSKFITLTFRDGSVNDVRDVRECNAAFEKFIKRLRKRYSDFKYLKVIEFQDTNNRGAVHYHFLSTLPYVPFEKLAELWGLGYIGINRIEHVDNVGAYVTSYMLKDFDDPRLRGEKAYSTSKNLIRPIVLHGADAQEIIDNYLQDKKEVFANSYESEYQGEITYKEYNLQREGK